ncbi:MAG: DEAD/DEAH box helicase family protein [Planctomycetaceae bacterium]|nr:DEAD/DEAH box helicase family protein [Planctomycetaceae bacterium]
MTLSELLEAKFRGDIRFRGAAYVQAERVAITHTTSEQVFAVVRDGVEFQTQLVRGGDGLTMACSCRGTPQNASSNPFCKHLWATILAVDAGDYLTAAAKPGFVPQFKVDDAEFGSLEFSEEEFEDPDEVPIERRTVRRAPPATAVAEPVVRLPEWENRLRDLRRLMQDASGGLNGSTPTDREIIYEIDAVATDEAGQVIIQTSQRQRRANGEWGKLKPLKLRPGRLEEIDDEEDRRILAHLVGGTPERAVGPGDIAATSHRYRVPHDLCQLLLPAMCETGRVRLLDTEERMTETLAWDDQGPWELLLTVEHDTEREQWRLTADLQRDGESLSIRKPSTLVPGGLFVHDGRIGTFEDFDAFPWVSLMRRSDDLVVPNGDEHTLVERLLDMPALPRLSLPPELQLEEVSVEPHPVLLLHTPARRKWQSDRLKAEVLFDYDGTQVRGSSHRWAIVQRDQRRCLLRDRDRELERWSELQQLGVRRLLDQKRGQHDVELGARELGHVVRRLMTDGWQVRADGKQVREGQDLRFQVKSGIDWFELHGNVDFGGGTVAFPELLAALSRGDQTIVLDDGSLGILPEEWIRQFGMLSGLALNEEDHLRFSAVQVGLLDALLSTQTSVDYDEKFEAIRQRLRDFTGIDAVKEPEGFQGSLREYQREGVGWMRFLEDFNFGGCLADDMGLGKTIQVLAFLLDRVRRRKIRRPSLVVVPKSLLFNWRQESQKFAPVLRVLEYSGIDRAGMRDTFAKHDIILTTYGTLRRDILALKDTLFDCVVLDEAQAIKNSASQVAKATRLLRCEHRLALSGTPIENHLGDLCSIFEFLNPGMLGRSAAFRLHATEPENRESRRILAEGLRPFILRRTKRGVASELPEKSEQTIYCEMGEDQQRLYNQMRDHFRESLLGQIEEQGLARSKMHVLEALLRLRQAACHPALLDKATADESSAKLDALLPQIQELLEEGHKTLVFSQFTSMLAIVKQHLDREGIVYEYLDGQTRNRKERVERFQTDEKCGVFLISLKAGGLGLNLTAADYVFILDPWWNPAVETQAIDRAHRVGQTRPVFAYRLIARHTVEEKIAELQQQKRELADAILEQDGSLLENLTADDLQMLLS